jgi:hypothetical protein
LLGWLIRDIRAIRVEPPNMLSFFSRKTLQLKISASSPFLRGILYFFLTIPLVLLASEIVARSPLGTFLPAPSIQADNFLFEAKIYALERQVRQDGKLDCLFIGSSVSNSDIDPEIVERVYRERTGSSIHCYNLGIPALTLKNGTAIADAVITRFHPKVLIYALLPRDINDLTANADHLETIDWITYNQGHPSFNGWLVNHSYGWRYFLTWRYWLIPKNRIKMAEDTLWLTSKGFQPAQGIREPYIPNPTMTPERLRGAWADVERVQTMERFLALREKGVTIVLVEGPAYHEPDQSDAETWRVYQTDYLPTLLTILETNNIPFWRTEAISIQVPKPNWYDWLHLNSAGAKTFSEWLGEQMADNAELFK